MNLTPTDLQRMAESEQRKRMRRTAALTPQQRLERFIALQAAAEQLLASNSLALAAFHVRNRRQRRESRVRELEVRLRRERSKDSQP